MKDAGTFFRRAALAVLLVAGVGATASCSGCGNGTSDAGDTGDGDVAEMDTEMEEDADTGEMDTETPDDTMDADDGGETEGATARAMLIHNSADPAASTVDVFLNGNLLIDDFKFRTALPFTDVPAGDQTFAIAPSSAGSEGSDTTLDDDETALVEKTLTLAEDETYVAVASGVRQGEGFQGNPGGASTGLDIKVKSGAMEDSSNGNQDAVMVYHGATDAPAVDARIDNAEPPQIEGLGYGSFTNYTNLPATIHTVDVETEDNSTRVASLQTGSLPGGEAWVVVASGFLTPGNDNGGKELAMVAFQAQTASETDIVQGSVLKQAARVQLVHAAPESAVAPVDVWEKNTGRQIVDDLGYEKATPFVSLPAGTSLNLGVAASDSSGFGDNVAKQTVTFSNGATRVVVASGVTDASQFSVNNPNFGIRAGAARESGSTSSDVDFNVFHGSVDAPTVDLNIQGGPTYSGLSFGQFLTDKSGTNIQTVATGSYTLEVIDSGSGNTAATFTLPLSNASGAYRTIVASGFLTTGDESGSSSSFKLLAVAPDGTVTPINPN